MASKLLRMFANAVLLHVSHEENEEADELGQKASNYKETPFERIHPTT